MSGFTNRLSTTGMLGYDPTTVINTIPTINSISTANGIWGQRINTTIADSDPYADVVTVIRSRIEKLELTNRLLKLKILQLEGTFTKEEVINIRAMLMSNDEASITLADSIIENA